MRWLPHASALLLAAAPSLAAQGGLDRTPNLSGGWVVQPGTVQFNFLHRFVRSPGPVRKVSNFPTFLVATSVLRGTVVGFNYATNSTLAPAYPNEWEFLLRARPLSQAGGFPVDLAGQVGWNLAADGPDGELTVARRVGRLRLIAVGRALTDPAADDLELAVGGGAAIRVGRYLALQGDLSSLTDRPAGQEAAWSAGLVIAIPGTPHTLSLHATNTNTGTLQGSSRGSGRTRYGFEFTIPINLARYFSRPPARGAGPAAEAPGAVAGDTPGGPVVQTGMSNLAFTRPVLEIQAGTTVEWRNDDAMPHSVTADNLGFDSGLVEAGATWRFTFTRPGTYTYHCSPHPFMRGTVVVK